MTWRKAEASGTGGCVEVNIGPSSVHVRDSKHPRLRPLYFTHEEWAAFLTGVKNGEFDLPT